MSDELRDRQTGLITKGDGYVAPKADQVPRIMEAIEVEKIVKKKARRAARPIKKKEETQGSDPTETSTASTGTVKADNPTAKTTTKKESKQSRTVSLLQPAKGENTLDRPCAYYNSAGGCSLSTSCKYSHRLPTDVTKAKQVKYMMGSLHMNGSSDFNAAYPNLDGTEQTPTTTHSSTTSKNGGAKKST